MSVFIENIQYNSYNKCRACLKSQDAVENLHTSYLKDLFMSLTNLKISEDDGFPSKLCLGCVEQLNISYSFREQCVISDQLLKRTKFIKMEKEDNLTDYCLPCMEPDVPPFSPFMLDYIVKIESGNGAENTTELNKQNVVVKAEHIELTFIENVRTSPVKQTAIKARNIIKTVATGPVDEIGPSWKRAKKSPSVSGVKYKAKSTTQNSKTFNLNLQCPECKENYEAANLLEAHFHQHLRKMKMGHQIAQDETPLQRRRRQNREAQARRRARQSNEQIEARRAQERARALNRRQNECLEEGQVRRRTNSQRMAIQRAKQKEQQTCQH